MKWLLLDAMLRGAKSKKRGLGGRATGPTVLDRVQKFLPRLRSCQKKWQGWGRGGKNNARFSLSQAQTLYLHPVLTKIFPLNWYRGTHYLPPRLRAECFMLVLRAAGTKLRCLLSARDRSNSEGKQSLPVLSCWFWPDLNEGNCPVVRLSPCAS